MCRIWAFLWYHDDNRDDETIKSFTGLLKEQFLLHQWRHIRRLHDVLRVEWDVGFDLSSVDLWHVEEILKSMWWQEMNYSNFDRWFFWSWLQYTREKSTIWYIYMYIYIYLTDIFDMMNFTNHWGSLNLIIEDHFWVARHFRISWLI